MAIVTLGDVAIESRETWKSDKENIPIVGLEHLEPGEISLSKWDINSDNTFTKMFRKGQVLLGRRRVYLRKAVIAPTDGICSGDITVIEAMPGKILPELLPFIIQNDRFFDYAMQGSAGSLSPRVKWEHLKEYKFQLPNLEEQKALADKLWAAYNLKSSYNKLLAATDEMVKSQFIEMFKDCTLIRLGDYISTQSGGTPNTKKSEYYDEGTIPWLSSGEVNQGYISSTEKYITEDGLANSAAKWVPENSVVIAMYGATAGKVGFITIPLTTNQAVCALLPNDAFDPLYLYYAVSSKKGWMIAQCRGAAQPNISQGIIRSMEIPMPSLDEQMQFANIIKQADKSKFTSHKSQFIEMFGSIAENSKQLPQKKLGEVATLLNGRAYKANELLSQGKYIVLRVGNFFTNSDYYYSDMELESDKYCDTGDLLYSWSATLGAQIWSGEKVIYHYHIWKVVFDEAVLNKKYLCYMLNYMTDALKQETHGSTMVHLTKEGMEKKLIVVPSMEIQNEFSSILDQADKSKYIN